MKTDWIKLLSVEELKELYFNTPKIKNQILSELKKRGVELEGETFSKPLLRSQISIQKFLKNCGFDMNIICKKLPSELKIGDIFLHNEERCFCVTENKLDETEITKEIKACFAGFRYDTEFELEKLRKAQIKHGYDEKLFNFGKGVDLEIVRLADNGFNEIAKQIQESEKHLDGYIDLGDDQIDLYPVEYFIIATLNVEAKKIYAFLADGSTREIELTKIYWRLK